MRFRHWLGLAAVAFAAVIGARAQAEPRIALVIGNAQYSSEIGVLRNPVNDARLVAKALRQVGFEVTAVENTDHAQLSRTIEGLPALVRKAGPEATVLVYYAGKGVQIAGRAYLLPVDVSWKGPITLDQHGVALDAVLAATAQAKTRIIFYDGDRRRPPTLDAEAIASPSTNVEMKAGTIVAFSTSAGMVVRDVDGVNGPYAMALSRAILAPGLSSDDVLRQIRIDVAQATREMQVPWDSSLMIEPFYFLPEK